MSNRLLQYLLTFLFVLQSALANAQNTTRNNVPFLPDTPYDYGVDLPVYLRDLNPTNLLTGTHKATLGRVIFYDKRLSANSLVSCSSCHAQANGFDDPSRFSIGFKGIITKRSAMGLVNARFNSNGRYFWDERAPSLKKQVLQPFFDPIEMGMNKGALVKIVANMNYYNKLFQNAFDSPQVTRDKIAIALATFINAMVATQSPYSLARAKADIPTQDFPTFSAQQNRGKMLFFNPVDTGGAGCSSCHQGEAMISPAGGQNNGLGTGLSKDPGIAGITNLENDKEKFRPPSLSNIAVRAPYMHDGRFENLEQVIDHYSTGIADHPNLGAALKDNSGKPRRFNFSPTDKRALIAFLQTLSDEVLMKSQKFSDPFRY